MKLQQLSEAVDKAVILAVLTDLKIADKATIDENGLVNVSGGVRIPSGYSSIPVHFGEVSGFFKCSDTSIASLIGAPSRVGGNFYCYNTHITSLEYAPLYVGGNFYCHNEHFTTLQNIHKTDFRNVAVGGTLYISNECTNILGLAAIPGVKRVGMMVDNVRWIEFDISHNDIMQFQDELIDAGYPEKARL